MVAKNKNFRSFSSQQSKIINFILLCWLTWRHDELKSGTTWSDFMREKEPLFESISYERAAMDANKKTQVSMPSQTDEGIILVDDVHADREDTDYQEDLSNFKI